MASEFDQMFATDDAPLLMADFGETITHYPNGDTTSPAPETGIFRELGPTRQDERGAEVIRSGELKVADTVAVNVNSAWLIRTELWQTLTVEAAVAGLYVLTLQRNDIEHQGRAGGGLR